MPDIIKQYLNQLEKELQTGNATEHSYRPHLINLFESIGKNIHAINDPKRIKCGAPDLTIEKEHTPLGYIETKDIGISLGREEKSEQISRYLAALPNLILTDYLEFRWYMDGKCRETINIGKVSLNRVYPDYDQIKKLPVMIHNFLAASVSTVSNPKDLAQRLAALANLIKDSIQKSLNDEDSGGTLRDQMTSFREVLIHDLSEEQFSDMYAQTICYGLFAARCNTRSTDKFTRGDAASYLPKTNPFLRRMFGQIAGLELDERVAWVVDCLITLLLHVDIDFILKDFGKRTYQEDPVVHFYETFLSYYNPEIKDLRGVYYTPEPVVSYIVKSIDSILKNEFKLSRGLADYSLINEESKHRKKSHRVQILDPACGTGTFLYCVVDQIFKSLEKNRGSWPEYVKDHLLPRLYGFEILMAPYAVAHMKLGLLLKELDPNFQADQRLGIYLTNTLEESIGDAKLPFAQWLADEANLASQVKRDTPVMVILGNPPYSGESPNKSEWIHDLMRGKNAESPSNYFEADNKPLRERNPKWLNNDFVKFIRFCQWRIERTGTGILGLITPHRFLSRPTYRGMRDSLTKAFDQIFLLDLHGSTRESEKSPNGIQDKNVFQILEGVSIGIFVRLHEKSKRAKVFHSDLWGPLQSEENATHATGKYPWLLSHDVKNTPWTEISPRSPHYLFAPLNDNIESEYNKGWSLSDAMPFNSVGITSARDKLTICWSEDDVLPRIKDFSSLPPESARSKYEVQRDSLGWELQRAQDDLRTDAIDYKKVVPIAYRPFDIRYTYYTGRSGGFIGRPRYDIMKHLLEPQNLALCSVRQVNQEFRHIFCVTEIVSDCVLSTASSERAYIFPQYIYDLDDEVNAKLILLRKMESWSKDQPSTVASKVKEEYLRFKRSLEELYPQSRYQRIPNLHPDFISEISENLELHYKPEKREDDNESFGPQDVFDYSYGMLHSSQYRNRYSGLLRIQFPKIPLTQNVDFFMAMCGLGRRLVLSHTLNNERPDTVGFPKDGNNRIDFVNYKDSTVNGECGLIFINEKQYFTGVSSEVWNFQLGGFYVCRKWLKDREGRVLSWLDVTHYEKMISSITETMELVKMIDSSIADNGGFPLQ